MTTARERIVDWMLSLKEEIRQRIKAEEKMYFLVLDDCNPRIGPKEVLARRRALQELLNSPNLSCCFHREDGKGHGGVTCKCVCHSQEGKATK